MSFKYHSVGLTISEEQVYAYNGLIFEIPKCQDLA